MTDLTARKNPYRGGTVNFHDPVLEAGGIIINQDNYDSSLDRTYDVRGMDEVHVKIKNTHGSNGLTFKIERAEKSFSLLSELVDADFDRDLKVDTNVAAGLVDRSDIIDISPETTSIRIRIKRQVASQDATLQGFVSAHLE